MAVFLSPVGGAGAQFCDNNGNPLNGGKLYTYLAGTTTPAATYTSSAGATFHPNPIILNAGGRVPDSGEIWLTDSVSYKFVLKTSADVLIATWDNITGINSNFVNFTAQEEVQTATAGQTVFTLADITYTPGSNNLQVFVDGVNQIVDDSYIETNSTTVTFVSGLHVGALVKFTTAVSNSSGIETDAALVTYDPPFTGSESTTVEAKLAQYISVVDFGAVGNGTTVCTTEIQTAFDTVNDLGGGTIYFPQGVFLIDDPIIVYSNTTVVMSGEIKVDSMPVGGYETVFVTDPAGANDIAFINPRIDGNDVVPTSGIMVRYGATNVRVEGGHIHNCANDSSTPGGRAFNIEGGTAQQNITITGTTVSDCWNGFSLAGGDTQDNSNVSVSNLTISDCQIAISLFGNTTGYPHSGEFMQAVFSNIAIRNCGHLTTFTTQAGVICSDRGSNVSFSDIYVFNDSTYGAVGALWRGDANNISMTNVTMDGDLTSALFDFSSYAESNSYPLSTNSSLDSRFINIKHNGTIPEVIVLPIIDASYLTNCQFDVLTDVVTSDSPINTNLANKADVYIKAQNKTSNAILQGYCTDIADFENDFADWEDQEQNFSLSGAAKAWALIDGTTGTVNRGFGITCTRNSTGDYTIGFTRPLPTVNYVVLVQATPINATAVQADEVSAKLGTGFTLQTSSGGVQVDKTLINIAVFY